MADSLTRAVRELDRRLTGQVSLPGDAGYAVAQPWNLAVRSAPRAVVHGESGADIAAAVRFAAAHDLRVAVRSTGHGATPTGEDVLLIHTGRMGGCSIDPAARSARVQAGATWQRVIEQAAPYGLAPVGGAAPAVGVVGYLTGGGIGPLVRTYGVSSDLVRALSVVTGEGRQLSVTPTEHEDLFWGLRGGKATLGIVTEVEVDLVALPEFYGGALWFDAAHATPLLRAWWRLGEQLPDEGSTSVAVIRLPPLPTLPAPISGRTCVAMRFAWTGDPGTGDRHLSELRRVAEPLIDDVRIRPITEIGQVHSDPVAPMPTREHSALLGTLTEAAIDTLLAAVGTADNRHGVVELRLLGGASAGAARYPSAVCHRDADYLLFMSGVPVPDETEIDEHARTVLDAMSPWTQPGLLANFVFGSDAESLIRCYDPDVWERLVALGDRYDPDRVLDTGWVARRSHRP